MSVVDFGEDPQFGAYMVMELVEGEPLARTRVQPMSIHRAIDVLVQVSDALDHIHKRGIVHGDVKADNILLAAEAGIGARRRHIVRLLDFGLARRAGGVEGDEPISGSPHYLAPERAGGGAPSVATDIYALGVLGYLMLTGTLPFTGNVVEILVQHLQDVPDGLSARRGEPIDDALEALVLRAMAKDPAARHTSVSAFRYELNTVMDMLDMGRRKRTSPKMAAAVPRDALLFTLFDGSSLPQLLVSPEGTILLANPAVRTLLGGTSALEGIALADTVLASHVPGLVRAVRSAAGASKASRKAARADPSRRRSVAARPDDLADAGRDRRARARARRRVSAYF